MQVFIVKPPSDDAFDKYHIMRTEWVSNNVALHLANGIYTAHLTFHFNRPNKKNGEFVMPFHWVQWR